MAPDTGLIEAEAISFIFKLAFGLLSGIVALAYAIIWNQSSRIQVLEVGLAVNTERDSHIDKELVSIREWMAKLDDRLDDLKNVG